jgi:hypothetical protein
VVGAVTPPTAATQFTKAAAGTVVTWYSDPLDAVSLSGNVTFNIWARESATAANATVTAAMLRADGSGNILSTIATVLIPRTELTTTLAVQNWARTPALTSLSNGDRLALRLYIDDGNGVTMVSGRTVTATLAGATGGVSGDSWLQTTEALAPARPSTGPVSGASSSQLTAGWALVDGATGYLLAASVNPANPPSPVASSSETAAVSATVDSLGVNATYYLFVKTNGPLASSSWSAYSATATLANAPAFSNFSGVGTGAIQYNWSVNGNPASVTRYRVLVSTAPDPLSPAGARVTSSDTYNTFLSTSGLSANTTYYFRAAAINHSGVITSYIAAQSTSTLAVAPAFSNFTNITAGDIRFNWTVNGNAPGTLYRVLASTAPDPSAPAGAVVSSSDTYNLFLATTGLQVNTTYYFRAAGINNNGIVSGLSAAASTATLTVTPVFSDFSEIAAASMRFGWSSGGNPDGTLYRVLASTASNPLAPGGALVTSSDTYNMSLSTSGLSPDVAYYFRAAAVNRNGLASGYSAAESAYTLAVAPNFTGFTVPSAGVVRADWTRGTNPVGALYRVAVSTAPDPLAPDGAVVSSSDTYNLYLSSSGLEANTTITSAWPE